MYYCPDHWRPLKLVDAEDSSDGSHLFLNQPYQQLASDGSGYGLHCLGTCLVLVKHGAAKHGYITTVLDSFRGEQM